MDAQTIVDTVAALDETTAISIITAILQSRPELAPAVVTYAVPDLTYPPSKALNERRSKGAIKSFNPEKGFGFITCEELECVFGSDVFVHQKQINGIAPGTAVSFAVVLNKDNRPQAYDVQAEGGGGWGKGGGGSFEQGGSTLSLPGKGGGLDQWTEEKPGFNASVMLQMMSSTWGGKIGTGKGKGDAGGAGGSCGGKGKTMHMSGGQTKEIIVADEALLGEFMGHIKSFNPKQGYGFIECPDLRAQGYTKDVFLHHNQLGEFEVGSNIQFTAFINNKGTPQAKDLEDPLGSAPKKAKTM